tara:strand:+ start:6518 stop:6655 length:138 start_codon:yes stop_codon:yes gene_type:complete
MKKLTHEQKPSDKKSVKTKAAKKGHADIIYLGQQSDIKTKKAQNQ